MGAGKSTIGRLLSGELKVPFKDSDKEIEERTGADIPWIFDVEGEGGFREREQAVIDDLSNMSGIILATGGGAILRQDNRTALSERGTVVYLKTSVEQQLERTGRDKNRPLLQTDDPRQTLTDLLAERDPLYLEIADIVALTDRRPPKSVVKEILDFLGC